MVSENESRDRVAAVWPAAVRETSQDVAATRIDLAGDTCPCKDRSDDKAELKRD